MGRTRYAMRVYVCCLSEEGCFDLYIYTISMASFALVVHIYHLCFFSNGRINFGGLLPSVQPAYHPTNPDTLWEWDTHWTWWYAQP